MTAKSCPSTSLLPQRLGVVWHLQASTPGRALVSALYVAGCRQQEVKAHSGRSFLDSMLRDEKVPLDAYASIGTRTGRAEAGMDQQEEG